MGIAPDLDQVSHVHGHLVDAGVVEFLDVVQCTFVVVRDEIDGNAFATKSATTSDSEKFKKKLVKSLRPKQLFNFFKKQK